MSKYRQDKTIAEQDRITDNLNVANNVAIILYDIYSRDALENYMGFWRAADAEDEESEEWESDNSE